MMTWTTHRKEVKNHAKRSLAGNFLKGVFAALIAFTASVFALSFMPIQIPDAINTTSPEELLRSMIPSGDIKTTIQLVAISLLLYLLLTSPLSIGTHRFYLMAVRGEKPKFRIIFSSFTSLKEVFSSCVMAVVSTIWQTIYAALLFAIPFALIILSPKLGPLAQIAGLGLYIVAFFLLSVLCTPFMLAPFALAENPERGGFKSILIAMKRLRGAKLEFLVFNLSFILWRVLFGLNAPGAFFIEPYISSSMAGFYLTADACKK